jgi:hypothetical protein
MFIGPSIPGRSNRYCLPGLNRPELENRPRDQFEYCTIACDLADADDNAMKRIARWRTEPGCRIAVSFADGANGTVDLSGGLQSPVIDEPAG